MKIEKRIYQEILTKLDATHLETGGIIGEKDGVVCRFFLDIQGQGKQGEYRPNVCVLNQAIEEWADERVTFVGLVHTHINGLGILSPSDIEYARAILSVNELDYVYFPVVAVDRAGNKLMRAYRVCAETLAEEEIEWAE